MKSTREAIETEKERKQAKNLQISKIIMFEKEQKTDLNKIILTYYVTGVIKIILK
jgi:hypothetical protein